MRHSLIARHCARSWRPKQRSGNTRTASQTRRQFLRTDTHLDNFYLSRPDRAELQLDLFGDYKSNVALSPTFQQYFRTHRPPLLAIWGKNDPFFLPQGAEAYHRDIPDAEVRFLDTGHFALETHSAEICAAMRNFLGRVVAR